MSFLGIPGSQISQEYFEAMSRSLRVNKWVIWDNYEILDGEIAPAENANIVTKYIPSGRFELPGEFAKLAGKSEEAILDFVHKYGLLGYEWGGISGDIVRMYGMQKMRELKTLSEIQHGGDPVSWILGHAITVNLIMSLTEALNNDDTRRLDRIISSLRFEDPDSGHEIVAYAFQSDIFPVQQYADLYLYDDQESVDHKNNPLSPDYDVLERAVLNDSRVIALHIVAEMINANLQGINRSIEIVKTDKGMELKSLFSPYSLLSSIYWMLADAFVSGRVRTCEECGSPFVADTDRRKFCPPIIGKDASPCMNRYKQRQLRIRREQQNSKTRGDFNG